MSDGLPASFDAWLTTAPEPTAEEDAADAEAYEASESLREWLKKNTGLPEGDIDDLCERLSEKVFERLTEDL